MYTEDNDGHVVITLTHHDYNALLLVLGFAAGGAMQKGNLDMAHSFLKLANSINVGNPDWTPYLGERSSTDETSTASYD